MISDVIVHHSRVDTFIYWLKLVVTKLTILIRNDIDASLSISHTCEKIFQRSNWIQVSKIITNTSRKAYKSSECLRSIWSMLSVQQQHCEYVKHKTILCTTNWITNPIYSQYKYVYLWSHVTYFGIYKWIQFIMAFSYHI